MPNTIDNVKLQATSDTLRVVFASCLEFKMSSCGYIRSSIFADTIITGLMTHLTQKTFALEGKEQTEVGKEEG
jgi:hypothetical protein